MNVWKFARGLEELPDGDYELTLYNKVFRYVRVSRVRLPMPYEPTGTITLDAVAPSGPVGKVSVPVVEVKVPAELADTPGNQLQAQLLAAGRVRAGVPDFVGDRVGDGHDVTNCEDGPRYTLPPKQFYKSPADWQRVWVKDNWKDLVKSGTDEEKNERVNDRLAEIKARGWT